MVQNTQPLSSHMPTFPQVALAAVPYSLQPPCIMLNTQLVHHLPIPNHHPPSPPKLTQDPTAYILVYSLTSPSAPTKSPSRTSFAMSKFSGLSASPPALSSCCTASSELTSPYAGVHDVFSRSRQISPVLKETFGWQQGVRKVMVGGLLG